MIANMLPFLKAKPKADHLEGFSLRCFKPSDKKEVIDLIQKRFEDIGQSLDLEGDDKDLTNIERYWQDVGGDFMLLLRDNKIVGTIAVQPLEKEPHVARFSWFFLKPEVEGKGVSMYLLKWGLEWCIEHEMRSIELWTGEKRWWVHKIYGKFGFTHIGIKRKVRDNPPYYLLFFELELTPANVERLRRSCKDISLKI